MGAIIALAAGLEPVSALPGLWGKVGDATLTLLGLMVTSLVLDRAGFFRWCARRIAKASGASGMRLWWGLLALACVVTALLANDGAMLILVPVYAELLTGAGCDRRTAMAYLFPAGFMIDVASTPFSTSNLTNIMAADDFHLGPLAYARLMALPSVAVLVSSFAVCWIAFRDRVPPAIAMTSDDVRVDPLMFRAGWGALAALAAGYLVAHLRGWPVAAVSLAVALALLLLGLALGHLKLPDLPRLTPWSIVVFALSLFVIVDATARAGASAAIAGLWSASPASLRPLAVGATVAALSAGLNNLPALLLGLLGLAHVDATRQSLAAAVVGADVGPKLTPYGSLATLLWMRLLASRGFDVRWREYWPYGLALTPPVLAAGLAAVWIWGR